MAYTTITQKILGSDNYAEKKILASDINEIRQAIQTGELDLKPYNISMEGNSIAADAGENWIRRHNNTFEFYSAGSWRTPTTETILGFTAGEDLAIRQAVYINPTDGKVYKCSKPRYTDWVGLTKTSANAGDNVEVYNNNAVVGGFTGLNKGSWYGISSTPGELEISDDNLVGLAIDNTQMVLFKSTPDATQDDLINVNSKIFCELLNSGDIQESSIDKVISNTGLSGVTNNALTKEWSDVLPNLSTFLDYNNNINLTNDGELEVFYLNTSGNLIAGRINLLTDVFTQTHNIDSSDFPVATGDSTYNTDKSEKLNVYMLTEANTLIYAKLTDFNHTASPDTVALFVDAKVYDSNGNVIQTYKTNLLQAGSGEDYNGIIPRDYLGFYTSGNVAKAYSPLQLEEHCHTSDDNEEYHACNLIYDGSSFSATTGGYINYASNDSAYIGVFAELLDNNKMYIYYFGHEDDGGSTNEKLIEAYLYKKDLTNSNHSTVHYNSNASCCCNSSSVWVIGDAIYFFYESSEDGGWEDGAIGIYINGSQIFYRYDSDSNNPIHIYNSQLLMSEGYELYAELKTNGVSQGSIYNAYNRIEDTSSGITKHSTVGASDVSSNTSIPVYIFAETNGTKHFCDVTTTGYRVYDRTPGQVNFNDNITDTYVDKLFTYYVPYINPFWTNLISSIDTDVTVDNGTDTTLLHANKWDYYGDTIQQIYLTINSSVGKIQGTGDLSYYMLYE